MMKGEVSESKYIKDLKKQIQKLKKENGQLKKSNNRLLQEADELDYNEEEPQPSVAAKSSPKHKCRLCNSEVIVFDIVDVPYYRCPSGCTKGKLDSLTK
jgi:cell division septum initiation protein DivIVA